MAGFDLMAALITGAPAGASAVGASWKEVSLVIILERI